jgi:hypothetical protein
MTLDAGVFCMFPAPGSPLPDAETGLPGVRITQAPGGRPGAVSISTFRDDGWLDGSAALVRVNDSSAQILVTIYQSRQGADHAPRLQVLRLTGDSAAQPAPAAPPAQPAQAPAAAETAEAPQILAHVQRVGDVGGNFGEWMGTSGSRQWIEGFGLAPGDDMQPEDIEYQAVLGRDWLSPWVEGGKFCGSRGMALPLLGLKIRLKGDAAKRFALSYEATFVDGSSAGPVAAGETCAADSLAALESFRIDLTPTEEPRMAAAKRAAPPAKVPAAKAPPKKAAAKGSRR